MFKARFQTEARLLFARRTTPSQGRQSAARLPFHDYLLLITYPLFWGVLYSLSALLFSIVATASASICHFLQNPPRGDKKVFWFMLKTAIDFLPLYG